MLVDYWAISVVGGVDRYPVVGLLQDPREMLLALVDWFPSKICAVELQNIECAEGGCMVMLAVAEQVEDGEAVLVRDDCLAIDDAGLGGQPRDGVDDQRIAICEVIAVARDKADAATILLRQDPKTVMLIS